MHTSAALTNQADVRHCAPGFASPQPSRITAKLPSDTGSRNTDDTRCAPSTCGSRVRPMPSGRMPFSVTAWPLTCAEAELMPPRLT